MPIEYISGNVTLDDYATRGMPIPDEAGHPTGAWHVFGKRYVDDNDNGLVFSYMTGDVSTYARVGEFFTGWSAGPWDVFIDAEGNGHCVTTSPGGNRYHFGVYDRQFYRWSWTTFLLATSPYYYSGSVRVVAHRDGGLHRVHIVGCQTGTSDVHYERLSVSSEGGVTQDLDATVVQTAVSTPDPYVYIVSDDGVNPVGSKFIPEPTENRFYIGGYQLAAVSTDGGETFGSSFTMDGDFYTFTELNGVVWGGGGINSHGLAGYGYSTDKGATWTFSSIPGATSYITDVAHNGSRMVAVGRFGTSYSDDNGVTWATANDHGGERFFAISYSPQTGTFMTTNQTREIYVSYDGITWYGPDAIDPSVLPSGWGECMAYHNNTWILGTTSGYVLYSTDEGGTWSRAKITSGGDLQLIGGIEGIVWGDNEFVLVGQAEEDSVVWWKSADGITWEAAGSYQHDAYASPYDLAYANGTYVTVADGGLVFYSTDASTWSLSTEDVDTWDGVYGVCGVPNPPGGGQPDVYILVKEGTSLWLTRAMEYLSASWTPESPTQVSIPASTVTDFNLEASTYNHTHGGIVFPGYYDTGTKDAAGVYLVDVATKTLSTLTNPPTEPSGGSTGRIDASGCVMCMDKNGNAYVGFPTTDDPNSTDLVYDSWVDGTWGGVWSSAGTATYTQRYSMHAGWNGDLSFVSEGSTNRWYNFAAPAIVAWNSAPLAPVITYPAPNKNWNASNPINYQWAFIDPDMEVPSVVWGGSNDGYSDNDSVAPENAVWVNYPPAGVIKDGDVFALYLSIKDNNADSLTMPAGWTSQLGTATGDLSISLWTRTAQGDDDGAGDAFLVNLDYSTEFSWGVTLLVIRGANEVPQAAARSHMLFPEDEGIYSIALPTVKATSKVLYVGVAANQYHTGTTVTDYPAKATVTPFAESDNNYWMTTAAAYWVEESGTINPGHFNVARMGSVIYAMSTAWEASTITERQSGYRLYRKKQP